MDNYKVEIWELEGKTQKHGPDYIFKSIKADSPELALRKVLLDNKILVKVYAEVIWNEGLDRQKFEDYQLKI